MANPAPSNENDDKMIECPKDQLARKSAPKKDTNEHTIEYPLPYKEMEQILKSHDALRKSTTPAKEPLADEAEK
ncbi:hypothetical protein BVY04_04135 [bacterium M21]|nr:hypothetical protein BVY04_04135 [bacterium M21]